MQDFQDISFNYINLKNPRKIDIFGIYVQDDIKYR